MNDFRKEMSADLSDTRWLLWKFVWIGIPIIVVLSVIFFALGGLGYFGKTVIERKVFENSYQRSEAIKSQIATDMAVVAQIQEHLKNQNLDLDTRNALKAQLAAAKLRINIAKNRR